MQQPDAEIYIHRQGFILLMTAFDAAVFDLFRVALTNDFFGLIGRIGRQEKISLERLGKFGSFEVFRDTVIEEQLKSLYLRDVLSILPTLGVDLLNAEAQDRFIDLYEMVMRRNLHVHNRGIVDERYLDRDQGGTPRYNIHGLSLGDLAVIDRPYWDKANRLCRECIFRVSKWAASFGSVVPAEHSGKDDTNDR
jgi:hypothetical protein